MVKMLALIPLVFCAWLVGAWSLMLTVGIIHGAWIPQLPTIGYATALVIGTVAAAAGIMRGVIVTMIKEVGK